MAIEFDVEELIGKVDAITATQLPYAGSRAMNQLGWKLKSEAWPEFARRTFDRTVPFTTGGSGVRGGLRYVHERGSLSLEINLDHTAEGGQDPARYLFPTSTKSSGSIYITRFSRLLRAEGYLGGDKAAVPALGNPVLAENLVNGRLPGSYYKQLRDRVVKGESKKIKGDRYFIVKEGDTNPRVSHLKTRPGIYRVKASTGSPSRIFAFVDPPSVRQKWSFENFAEEATNKYLPSLLTKAIDEALK
jgi:hypothetical protein